MDFRNIGLRASRILRRGDCQRPVYKSCPMGRHMGRGLLAARYEDREAYIPTEQPHHQGLGTEREGGFGRGLASACSVLLVLLPPRSTFLPNVPLKSNLVIELVDN